MKTTQYEKCMNIFMSCLVFVLNDEIEKKIFVRFSSDKL